MRFGDLSKFGARKKMTKLICSRTTYLLLGVGAGVLK